MTLHQRRTAGGRAQGGTLCFGCVVEKANRPLAPEPPLWSAARRRHFTGMVLRRLARWRGRGAPPDTKRAWID